jgi:hypothetical protein
MLIGVIIIIGAVVGGVVGGTVHKNNTKTTTGHGPSETLSVGSSISGDTMAPAGTDGPLLSTTSSSPSPQSSTGAAASPNGTGRPPQVGSDPNGVVDMGAPPSAIFASVG